MPANKEYAVRDVEAGDAAAWAELYTGYRDFYGRPRDDEIVARAWSWVLGREHSLRGIVAVAPSADIVALANVRLFARPSGGSLGLYLDDLFTSPAARGSGAGGTLLRRVAEIAGEEGATLVRWITADSNATARRLYDAHATATPWVTYDMDPVALGS